MKREDVDLESHLGIDPGRLDKRVRVQLAEFVANREQRLGALRERALDAEQEARTLRNRVQSLEEQIDALEHETGGDGRSVRALDTESLVATFGDALSSERIGGSGFTVSDLSVDLRANVVTTDDGVRVALPEPGSRVASEGLSELRFSVRSDPDADEPDLEEVPDLIGMSEDGARETVAAAGFDVGAVDAVAADAEPGRVVDQLPSPYSLAEVGAPVDLEVAAPDEEPVDLVGESFAEVVRTAGDRFSLREIAAVESAEPPGTVIRQDPEPGEVSAGDRLSVTISAYPEPEERTEPVADESNEERETVESDFAVHAGESVPEELLDAAEAAGNDNEPFVDRDVEEIDGIGDTYGSRLRDDGIESLADLAVAAPTRVADAANVREERARDWIEAALDVARAMADEDTGGAEP